ncbi:MAG TPA: TonB family protein [Candidatus Binataceae bacterium]|nr:TonB family protein [Candidatus Binataceae bacterium]
MAKNDRHDDARPARIGYAAAIFFSAIGHVALFAFVFIFLPRYLHSDEAPPPSYTVKIVDSLPAGDLGSHLPRLAPRETKQEAKAEEHKAEEPKIKVEPPKPELAPDNDKNALAMNLASVTPTPTPTPEPTVEPTVEATLEPTPEPTEKPTPKPRPSHTKHATPKPTPASSKNHNKPKAEATVAIARVDKAIVAAKLAKLREQLMKEHIEQLAKKNAEDADSDDDDDSDTSNATGPSGGGPVAANSATAGKGYGIGSGTGSMGIQQDPEFLLYYQSVEDRIKKAWTFLGGSNDLTATVDFSIGPDGTLTSAKIGNSSKDGAFDDSVIRAIKRAAPFPPPPEKYRNQFSGGIEAVFNMGELKS